MTKGTGVIAWLDQGPSSNVSSHHYFLLLNSAGKSPEQLETYTRAAAAKPAYKVLKHNGLAHAIVFYEKGQKPLYSYVVFEGDKRLGLPYIASANKRLNMMLQEDASGNLVMSVCDPHVDIDFEKSSSNYERSRDREIRVVFDSSLKVELISSTSGLPQTNPPLGAKIVDNILSYTTRNGVTDTFTFISLQQKISTGPALVLVAPLCKAIHSQPQQCF